MRVRRGLWPVWCGAWLLLPALLVNWSAALTPNWDNRTFLFLLVYPTLEETTFRLGLQHLLLKYFSKQLGPVSIANILTSLVFATAHALVLSPIAALVFIPSLIFGWCYERSGKVILPIFLHATYNLYALLGFIPMQWLQTVLM